MPDDIITGTVSEGPDCAIIYESNGILSNSIDFLQYLYIYVK